MNHKRQISLLLSSLVNNDSSLGRIGQNWAKFFSKNDQFDLWMHVWPESTGVDKELQDLAKRPLNSGKFDVTLRKSDPYSAWNLSKMGKKNIAYVYYDAVQIREDVVKSINDNLTVLVTPSQFTKERFERMGVTIPVKVIPLAVNNLLFKPLGPKKDQTKFTFVNYGEQSHRKGTDLLLKAFCEEFKNQEDVELLMVICNFNRPDLTPNPKVWIEKENAHNVRLVMARPPDAELVEYINQGDCFVALTREDSFGMCGLEAMACGLPVIAPLNSGYAQYVKDGENGRLISGTKVEHERWEWIPSVEEGKKVMREMYQAWKTDKERISQFRKNALRTSASLNWWSFGKQFENLILETINK